MTGAITPLSLPKTSPPLLTTGEERTTETNKLRTAQGVNSLSTAFGKARFDRDGPAGLTTANSDAQL